MTARYVCRNARAKTDGNSVTSSSSSSRAILEIVAKLKRRRLDSSDSECEHSTECLDTVRYFLWHGTTLWQGGLCILLCTWQFIMNLIKPSFSLHLSNSGSTHTMQSEGEKVAIIESLAPLQLGKTQPCCQKYCTPSREKLWYPTGYR